MHDNPPAPAYADRLKARQATARALGARLDTLSYARLGAFGAALAVAGLAFGAKLFSPWFSLLPAALFVYLVATFEAARGRKAWAERAAAFYALGLSRLSGQPGAVSDGARLSDESHPYAADLDLFGPGSLFERLSSCRTRAGEDTLAAWLRAPAPPDEVKARQEAVADLVPRLDLREALAVAGADVPASDYDALARWGESPDPDAPPKWKRGAVEVLGWLNVLAWIGWLFADTTALPVLVCGLPSLLLGLQLGPWAGRVLKPLGRAAENLSLLEAVLRRIESESFSAPRLKELQGAMRAGGLLPSEQLRHLRLLLDGYSAQRNAFFIPVAVLRLWPIRFAFKLEAWRARSGPVIGNWLRAAGEVEALSSLAGYAFENPGDIFPAVA
ncbi:MAG: hypothetical protein K2V38_13855, partial [Gemmataceae bacterium]|nr:hypothetical protein [Gemmataceae bacterium]